VSPRTSTILQTIAAVAVVAVVAFGGYLVISQRAGGSGSAALPPASPSVSPQPSGSPSTGPTIAPQREHWLVAMLRRKVAVYSKPVASGAFIKGSIPALDPNFRVQNVCLVDKVLEKPGKVWYKVWLPGGPNGARGWISEGGVTTYPVFTKIVIDLSARQLTVVDGAGNPGPSYPVAIGRPETPTPKGHFFIATKIRPTDTTTAFGVFALALSAYSPTLAGTAEWGDGQVAIHGTNQPEFIGQAISHGCIRMKNDDILAVNQQVATGSPVVIQP
jgi:lipoprotein-anchoring transpeptidase ErfK/SrfK